MTTVIQLRRGTSTEWTTANPVLALGEAGIETNTLTWKVGDGVTDWANLSYMSGGGGNVTYGNSNVATFLANLGSNVISTTGNITADYFLGNGSQLTGITAVASTGNVTFNDINIIGTGNLKLQPDDTNAGAYLDVYLTTGPDVHIAGNGESVIIGSDDTANVTVAADGNVRIQASTGTPFTWQFSPTGNLTLPSTNTIKTSAGSNANIVLHPDGNGLVQIVGGAGGIYGVLLNLTSDEFNSLNRIEIDTFGNSAFLGGTFTGSFSRGNLGAPAAVQAGDRLVSLRGRGYDGSILAVPTGLVSIDAFDDWGPNNTPTQLSFYTTGYNNPAPILNMQIDPDGNVNIYNGNLVVTGGGGYLQGDTITGDGALYAGIPEFTPLGSDVVTQFAGNVNGYSQINFQNISNGAQASGDFIITANNGTDSTNFINLGIAGNTWDGTQPNSLGTDVAPNDGYLYVNGGNLVVGTDTSTWKFSTSGSFVQTPVPLGNLTAVAGARAFINNGNLVAAGNFGAQVDGSGSNTVPVWSDGSNWYIG